MNISKMNTPTASIPLANKKAMGYDLVLSATKPENMKIKEETNSAVLSQGWGNEY